MNPSSALPTAVIATPLGLEYDAVLDLLPDHDFHERSVNGTLFQLTELKGRHVTWQLAVTRTGRQNEIAAAAVERAIATFKPQVLLLVGVAGGRRKSAVGDVIAATEVYGYEAGRESDDGYFARIKTLHSAHALEQQAHQVAREKAWLDRITLDAGDRTPEVFLRPLAAGSKVVASTTSPIAELIDRHCDDAQGVETEGFGALAAAWMNKSVDAMVIRGVSDLLGGKTKEADQVDQPRAARNAAAFALALLERTDPGPSSLPEGASGAAATPQVSAGPGSTINVGAIGHGASSIAGAIGNNSRGIVIRLGSGMADRTESKEARPTGGYVIHGDVNAGAFGTEAYANVGAVGSEARGVVVDNGGESDARRLDQLLELLAETRAAMEHHRDMVGERFDGLSDRLDEIEEDLKARRPPGRIRRKLDDLGAALRLIQPVAAPAARLISQFEESRF